jgi:hypothetical protein
MNLPIRLFFSLHRQGVQMEARQYRERLRIAAVPRMTMEYYNLMNDAYESILDPTPKQLPPKPPGPCLEMGTLEARHILQSVMTNVKRNLGYGR